MVSKKDENTKTFSLKLKGDKTIPFSNEFVLSPI